DPILLKGVEGQNLAIRINQVSSGDNNEQLYLEFTGSKNNNLLAHASLQLRSEAGSPASNVNYLANDKRVELTGGKPYQNTSPTLYADLLLPTALLATGLISLSASVYAHQVGADPLEVKSLFTQVQDIHVVNTYSANDFNASEDLNLSITQAKLSANNFLNEWISTTSQITSDIVVEFLAKDPDEIKLQKIDGTVLTPFLWTNDAGLSVATDMEDMYVLRVAYADLDDYKLISGTSQSLGIRLGVAEGLINSTQHNDVRYIYSELESVQGEYADLPDQTAGEAGGYFKETHDARVLINASTGEGYLIKNESNLAHQAITLDDFISGKVHRYLIKNEPNQGNQSINIDELVSGLVGGYLDDILFASDLNSALDGGLGGSDHLVGGSGDDVLISRLKANEIDTVSGGGGADRFELIVDGTDTATETISSLIEDFNPFEGDRIIVHGLHDVVIETSDGHYQAVTVDQFKVLFDLSTVRAYDPFFEIRKTDFDFI
ncbi:MAG: hypothetical protein K9J47_01820, partial [Sulfuritalea sp.]|nr:hypothetical protein [Sulfuritalea sp.]